MSYAFDQINYNYTGYASIPNDTQLMVVHLEEHYNIHGIGQKFIFNITMRGAQRTMKIHYVTQAADLTGNGTIDTIKCKL